ncbi:MAG: acyl-CoA carboxylase subunit beta [Chlamydiales bacterium]|nr:acyl-CoA carboxylase subunit beta [Chlamydiales bacterium]
MSAVIASPQSLEALTQQFAEQEAILRQGGGEEGIARQHKLGRMLARERVTALLDANAKFFEIGLWAAYKMYEEWGEIPAAGVVAGIGPVHGRDCMIIANDATVKAGAFFPQSVKKVLRAQRIASECRLPIIYLVDSSGVFLPLQEDIFPDEDDFGRIFRNNAVLSANGIPQFAAVMGSCIAGGGYLPVLCDTLLMTEGSGLYLAGPALVKAAIGQVSDAEELGGATMHAEVSGTVDFHEPDDASCIKRLRSLIDMLPEPPEEPLRHHPIKEPKSVYQLISTDGSKEYDVHDLLATIVDAGSFNEYKEDYAKAIVTGYARINGHAVGIVANQRTRTSTHAGRVEIGGVLYTKSADKAARFVMDCNQMKLPIIFLQDVMGFMVGKEAEQSGIIRSGAKLVSAVSNSVVPKITVIVGNSFGAGNYALCGKAYDPDFILAWPNAKYTVMGAEQAANTLLSVQQRAAERRGQKLTPDEVRELRDTIVARYKENMDVRYGAARGWVDAIIAPHTTRDTLSYLLSLVKVRKDVSFHTGVIQT